MEGDETLLKAILPLTDVMGTGHHAVVSAGVKVGVDGRGRRRWRGRALRGPGGPPAWGRAGSSSSGRHESRIAIARKFGATDVVKERGEEGIARVIELTGGGRRVRAGMRGD